ncbi:MAG: DUF63 family protein [Halanaeroarchaeum sp.]
MFPETKVERVWTAVVLGAVAVLVGGSLLAPDLVYTRFLWQYFWGPVVADAHNAACVAWNGGAVRTFASVAACQGVAGPTAQPGYTLVSEVGYALTLIVAVAGLVFVLRRLNLGERLSFVYPLLPFMLFGGALRVVEDASDRVPAGVDPVIQFPLNALIISPFIYFTVFFLTLAALLLAVWLSRRDLTASFEWPLAGMGTGLLALTVGYLLWLSATRTYVAFHPSFTVLTMGFALLIGGGGWWLVRQYAPWIAADTPRLGAVVLWAHSVDGVSNVLGIDWGNELGLGYDMVPKHPINRAVIGLAERFVPESITAVVGTAWPFLLLKVVAALLVVSLFDDRMIADSPRFSTLLLIAVVAVGLGPGTRDMLRATFGV